MPLFGQILAALYQVDTVEEDDIRTWHSLSESRGEDRKPSLETENFKKCWVIGSHMIKQFDAQGSDSEEESEEEDEQEKEKVEETEKQKEPEPESEEITGTESEQTSEVETESEKETEEERHTKRRNTIVGPAAPVKAATTLAALPEKSDQGSTSKPQRASLATKSTSASNANPLLAPSEDSESDAYLTDSTEARDAGVSASEESSTPANTEDEESESD